MGQGASLLLGFRDHTQLDTPQSVGHLRTSDRPVAENYVTTHNIHNTLTRMPPVGFEPAILANNKPQNHALEGGATGIDVE